MNYYCEYNSPIGDLVIVSDGESIVWLGTKDHKFFADVLCEEKTSDIPIFSDTKKWLDIYFSGKIPTFTPSLSPQGSSFRQSIWTVLATIPYGKVVTYGDIAKLTSKQTNKDKISAQAVGGAVGHNPISIIIPCHRVVGSGGNLTGFACGIEIKIKLLELEQLDMSKFYTPKT